MNQTKRITVIAFEGQNCDVIITTDKICKVLKNISHFKVLSLMENGWRGYNIV